jgi:hypothetical protein
MGDNFLKRQAQNFKKGRELATGEMSQPMLFSRPEIVTTTYSAVPAEQCQLQSGEVLSAIASDDGSQVMLARGHKSIGRIEGDGAKSLLGALGDRATGGIAQVQITEVSSLSGVGKAVIVSEGLAK